MKKPRYLTKSRFKIALDCPTKLYYADKRKIYANSALEDKFLEALAEGGHQVGEYAKAHFPDGHDIKSLDYVEAKAQTDELLKLENVVIFEPAIQYKNLFIRIDILVKKGNQYRLLEVKAKSFDPHEEDPFLNKNGTLASGYKDYLYDVAFQKYVLQGAIPKAEITSFLVMTNKRALCPVDGLNQKFKIIKDENNRKGVSVSSTLTQKDLIPSMLIEVAVDEYIQLIYDGTAEKTEALRSFEEDVAYFAKEYSEDKRIRPQIGGHCKDCEYRCSEEDNKEGLKDGFRECWSEVLGWSEDDFSESSVLDIWNYRKKDMLIELGKIKLNDVEEEDIGPKPSKDVGLSTSERQWLQIEKVQNNDVTPYFDKHGMNEEMKKWKFPFHFIDFETTMVPLPFNKGRRPYEGVAFQFSHHSVDQRGEITHAGEFLESTPGVFPNYEFIRRLKRELENDQGTIFMYSHHENTFLNHIYRQLVEDQNEIADREELLEFIREISHSGSSTKDSWVGARDMVDMLELVKKYYYDPRTNGSNSIKAVLPAVLNSSKYLQEKYSKPIYGNIIKSLNFKDWKWIEMKGVEVVDPYKRLPKMFQGISEHDQSLLLSLDEDVANGGAALTAYNKMQFTEMSEYEREELKGALLKYCELDTFAMVMIYEAWREWGRD